MIKKNKSNYNKTSMKHHFGNVVEDDVAFYLRREFADVENVFIFNDVRFKRGSEVAQIDHLVLHRKGFILIESKSIKGQVNINSELEWTRTVKGNWVGMPSPIKQASLQGDVLREILNDNATHLLGKVFGLQGYFGGYGWDTVCACSNDVIINRTAIPKAIDNKIVKAEFISDKVLDIVKAHDKILSLNPTFSVEEMERISHFLCSNTIDSGKPKNTAQSPIDPTVKIRIEPTFGSLQNTVVEEQFQQEVKPELKITELKYFPCKHCHSLDTKPNFGKFGYYVACEKCQKNTSMNKLCSQCNTKIDKVNKSKNMFILTCKCGSIEHVTFS
ncbi:nuclease-related domain-containing protein [Vibrio splendidus]|nr:nuclease-related domain-containing protein [Vibrio splendidus]MCC4880473.1 NERD domain-containing protein [Vibrio splendidus]